jgi:transketolase
MAYSMKYIERSESRAYCVIGDGESAEGSVWEAFHFASHRQLDNLVAIIDVNRLGQSEPTSLQHDTDTYKLRLEAFGWHAVVVDGHELPSIIHALDEASTTKDKPTAIIARTIKGKDFLSIEDQLDWHGKPLGANAEEVLAHLRGKLRSDIPPQQPPQPANSFPIRPHEVVLQDPPTYTLGASVATRSAYGDGLKAIGKDERVVGLDGDTKNSTFALTFAQAYPQRFIECFIAEQNMVGVAVGLGTRGLIPFASTFATFFTRAFDFVRMAAISRANAKFVGSHCGVSIGEDGPSQMGLEDLALFRAIPDSLVLYPSDATSAYRAVQLAANFPGIAYIRTSRPANPVLYPADASITLNSFVLKSSPADRLTIVGAGVTLHEALSAQAELESEGVSVRVIDLFVVKPLDVQTLLSAARETQAKVLTVEDHYVQGGIYEAVNGALAPHGIQVQGIAVNEIPRSGKPHELMAKYGLNSACIVRKVKELLA